MSGVEYPRVTLVPGDGVVIRTPAFFCVVAAGTPEPVLAAIAGIESDVETPDGVTRRGRHLVRASLRAADGTTTALVVDPAELSIGEAGGTFPLQLANPR